ncbi:glcNAc-PI de-N-acetylase [bacterium BMS3Abin04]|nr:glcNAc-PI de-N-acetylase [bacterium BMS3Abin04]
MIGVELITKKELNILFLGAHSDDIEIGCGGTILKIIRNYRVNAVKWIVFSSNEVRKKEAQISAENFLQNVENKMIEFRSYRDGFLPFSATEIKNDFEQIKKSFNPDIIFTHYRQDRHQDHRFLSDLTWNTFRNHLILEYEIPKYDGDFGIPNFYIPLDEDIVNQKNEIIMNSFKSQIKKHWFTEESFNAILRLRGMESASRYSEAFYARKILF